ncbi:hypothetical protein RUESEDTHA_03318 [Ruegeria sp. THAF57]|uniref:heparin lyase I family protein n=1 Tax=Ruegeria sp. THAF57 TaxID=2744555 RepID=UPI0015DE43A5|nr:heparin lyase I family protein [Ruegeria sp. THAF57]CAD0186410.1 hypothetical protein RUESEDTHA_03318 [Ruegeria sp. THAF57]
MRLAPIVACTTALLCLFAFAAHSNPLSRWQISCGVDAGSIAKKGKTYTFKTSSNQCPGDGPQWKQRAEIYSDRVKPDHMGSYLFSSTISMTTNAQQKWDIFQIHDGRRSCAPPLKVSVLGNGHLELTSDVNTGAGEENCIRGKLSKSRSPQKQKLNGTTQKLDVLIEFTGEAGFIATVWLDDKVQLQGTYQPPNTPGAFQSKFFYFKHGVYSPERWDYVLVSEDLSVKKVKVK